MTFEEVLDQAIAMLQRRGRVTYRTLKRQFNLDDETLEDLKFELITGQRLASDEDGEVLVWIAASGTTHHPPSLLNRPVEQPEPMLATYETGSSPPEPPTPDAERRQLTVMFCDLADSTKLSSQLDPEDLRDVIRAYQSTSAEVIERYDGYIAQHLGDGLMIYFGWPQAHEDDAQRAVHAGLGIIKSIQDLNSRLAQENGVRLAVRVGIHTGLVVVGVVGSGASQEYLALGETPNIASRIQGVAALDTVAISNATYQLVDGFFDCEPLGHHTLRGVTDPQQVYRVGGASNTHHRLNTAVTRRLTPLVGREREAETLLDRWAQAKVGKGQVVVISGEAGIGKSRLLHVLRDHVSDRGHTRLECRCSPYYQNTALHPITDLFHRMLKWQADEPSAEQLAKLEDVLGGSRLPLHDTVPLLADLLSIPLPNDSYPPVQLAPQRQREKTLEILLAMLLEQAEQRPVLFILEDMHWTDPTTLEWLTSLIERASATALLIVLSCRPDYVLPWESSPHLVKIALSRFSSAEIATMVSLATDDKTLPPEVMQHLVEKTDGVPLYVEEMLKAFLDSGILVEASGQYVLTGPLSSLTVPATLQAALMARLDRLDTAKTIAQLGAVLGRQFSYDVLRVLSKLDDTRLQRELARLVEADLLHQRGLPPQAQYIFKHALIQDTAYESVLRRTRRQYHQQAAQLLETRFPSIVEAEPELIAHHYTEAEVFDMAATCWQRAGERASSHSAYMEAIAHLQRGLGALTNLPDTPEHAQHELAMQLALAASYTAPMGYTIPEVGQAYTRGLELCRRLGEPPELLPVMEGLRRFHTLRGELQAALELGEELVLLAQRQPGTARLQEAYWGVGQIHLYQGELISARVHLQKSMSCYTPEPFTS